MNHTKLFCTLALSAALVSGYAFQALAASFP